MNRDTTTTPLTNLLTSRDDLRDYSEVYSQVCSLYHDAKMRPVAFMKSRLGRQDYCFTGEFRYWVWEDDAGWRVYVSNHKGIGFEVDASLNLDEALKAWEDFQKRVGLFRASARSVMRRFARDFCDSIADASFYLQDRVDVWTEDDGDPEGGVKVAARFYLCRTHREKAREWAQTHIERRMPLWTKCQERTFAIVDGQEENTLEVDFYLPPPRLSIEEYRDRAFAIWSRAGGDYRDDVLRVRWDGRYLETERVSNRNPTTMIPLTFDAKTDAPVWAKCIRHHGEHIYITKHLLTLSTTEAP